MHLLKVACRWIDRPKEYGHSMTISNRFARWSERGIWQKIFETVATPSEPPEHCPYEDAVT
jgi:transposase